MMTVMTGQTSHLGHHNLGTDFFNLPQNVIYGGGTDDLSLHSAQLGEAGLGSEV